MSERTSAVRSSPIAEAKAWLGQRTSATPLLDLSQAAPSYPPAPVVVDRIAEVARSSDGAAYAPPFGMPALTEAFAARISSDYLGSVTSAQVLPTAGCNQAFCVVASALAGPGDEVLIHLPYYFNHTMWLEAEGIVPRFLPVGDDFIPDPIRTAELINDHTRAIALVTPGNPTGVTIPPSVIDAFARLAADHGIALVLDETYRNFRGTDAPAHHQFADPTWADTTVSLHSFSKDLAIPGYRVGAIVAGRQLLDQAAKLLDCVAICAPRISQEAALAGLLGADQWRRQQVERIAANLAVFRAMMADSPGGFELAASGAFFGWVRHPFVSMATDDVVKHLVLDHDVLAIPGTAFMPSDERWLRFSFANLDQHEFAELADRLEHCGATLAR